MDPQEDLVKGESLAMTDHMEFPVPLVLPVFLHRRQRRLWERGDRLKTRLEAPKP